MSLLPDERARVLGGGLLPVDLPSVADIDHEDAEPAVVHKRHVVSAA